MAVFISIARQNKAPGQRYGQILSFVNEQRRKNHIHFAQWAETKKLVISVQITKTRRKPKRILNFHRSNWFLMSKEMTTNPREENYLLFPYTDKQNISSWRLGGQVLYGFSFLFIYRHINLCDLFDAKTIIAGQQQYHVTHRLESYGI